MGAASGENLEQLHEMIVRAADVVVQVRNAKVAVSAVIFGQDRVIEHALITVLWAVTPSWSAFPG